MRELEIETYYDPLGRYRGPGCYRSRLRLNHNIHDAGSTPQEAYDHCVLTARSLGYAAIFRRVDL